MIRTIIMDPGFLQNPIDLEYQISQLVKKKKNGDQKIEIQVEPNQNPVNIIHHFQTKISEGPLNFFEYKKIKSHLVDAFSHTKKKNTEADDPDYIHQHNNPNNADIDSDDSNQNKLKQINKEFPLEHFSDMKFESTNFCSTCLRIKFERSHHCRQCGRCVLKMDHHCPWVANCIGFYNYKYFCLMNFYGFLTTFIFLATYWEVLVDCLGNNKASFPACVFYLFMYIAAIGFLAFLTWLNTNNIKLLINGETVIEQSDRERFPSTKSINPYDMGCYRNFTNIFGTNPLVWGIPFFANYEGNGYVYQKNNLSEDDV